MHCYFFHNNSGKFNSLVLCLCYPVLYTNGFAGLLCIVFVVYGLVYRKKIALVIVVLEM